MENGFYRFKYKKACLQHKYFIFSQGDIDFFPYPQCKRYSKNFSYDAKSDLFLLQSKEEKMLKKFAFKNYNLLKNTSKRAYFVNCFHLLGQEVGKRDRIKAYWAIKRQYTNHWIKKHVSKKYSIVHFDTLPIHSPYEELRKYWKKSLAHPVYILKIKNAKTTNIAYQQYGFNILYIDNNPYNYGVGLIECILANEKGIQGRELKHLNIIKTEANPQYMALKDIVDAQEAPNPDLFFMKGYLGLAFNEKDTVYNALYAITEPFIKLLFSTIGMKELLDYVFFDKTKNMREKFEKKYPNCYEKIYTEKNIFKRMDILMELSMTEDLGLIAIYKILFNAKKLVNTRIHHRVIALIYFSKCIQQNKRLLFDLITDCYTWALEYKIEITLTNWSKHVKLKFGDKAYTLLAQEYRKYKRLLDEL